MKKNIIAAATLVGVGMFIGIMLVSNITPDFIKDITAEEKPAIGADAAPINLDEPSQIMNKALTNASEAATPSVVSINVLSEVGGSRMERFHEFFEFFGRPREEGEAPKREGMGSGVIISKDGYIVTNNHVVENAVEDGIEIISNEKKKYKAELIGRDELTDLAVLKIEPKEDDEFKPAHFGNMDDLKVGEMVLAVGNPLGLNSTVTSGIVSAISRGRIGNARSSYSVENYIQTDAAINPGNSGGGLFDLEGSLVGINTAIATQTGTYIGYGFAIPIDLAKAVIDDIIEDGKVDRGYIGVQIRNVDETYAKKYGLDEVKGIIIMDVLEDMPASNAGIQPTDIILEVNGKEVRTTSELQSEIALYRAGDEVKLTIWRDGKEISKTVTLKAREEDEESVSMEEQEKEKELKDTEPVTFEDLGFTAAPLNDRIRERYDIKNGVYVSDVTRYSPANERGLFKGQVITKVEKEPISSPAELKEIIDSKKSGEVFVMYVRYRDSNQIIAIEKP